METKQMKRVQGVVIAAAQNSPDRWGIRIGNEWYGGFGRCPVEKGAVVEVAYVENGRYRNVKEIELLAEQTAGAGSSEDIGSIEELPAQLSQDSRIARAVALKCAVQKHAGNPVVVPDDTVLHTAARFEKWLNATSPQDTGAV